MWQKNSGKLVYNVFAELLSNTVGETSRRTEGRSHQLEESLKPHPFMSHARLQEFEGGLGSDCGEVFICIVVEVRITHLRLKPTTEISD